MPLNESELKYLFSQEYPKLVGWLVQSFGFSQDDAMDVASEAFCQVIQSYDSTKGASMKRWLYICAQSRAKDSLAKRRRQLECIQREEQPYLANCTSAGPDRTAIEMEAKENRKKILRALSWDSAQIFDLWINKEYRPQQIADILGISVKEVNTRQQRLRREFLSVAQDLNLTFEDLV